MHDDGLAECQAVYLPGVASRGFDPQPPGCFAVALSAVERRSGWHDQWCDHRAFAQGDWPGAVEALGADDKGPW
jgi:hypothetical protein